MDPGYVVPIKSVDSERKKLEEDREAFEKEKLAWQTIESKLEASQLGEYLMLNVGGTIFSCSIETLRKIPDSYFFGLVSGRWILNFQKDGSIFIDRDPTAFSLIMTYMHMYGTDFNILKWRRALSNPQKMLLRYEAEFFMLPGLLDPIFPSGAILDEETWESIHPSSEKRQLLFTSSDQNTTYLGAFGALRQKTNLLLVAKLPNGEIVGAFTSIAWIFSNNYQLDSTAFLLSQKVGSALSKHPITPEFAQHATLQNSNEISFGAGVLNFTMPQTPTGQITVIGDPYSDLAIPINLSSTLVVTNLEIWSLE